jgi:hypothetical protein
MKPIFPAIVVLQARILFPTHLQNCIMTKALQKILILAQIGPNNETLFRCRQQTLLPARKAHFTVPTVARIEHSGYSSFICFNSAAAHEMSTARNEAASARGFLGFLLLKCSSCICLGGPDMIRHMALPCLTWPDMLAAIRNCVSRL